VKINAAVEQLAANSADVASNNRMADGGSFADVVAAAQANGGHADRWRRMGGGWWRWRREHDGTATRRSLFRKQVSTTPP